MISKKYKFSFFTSLILILSFSCLNEKSKVTEEPPIIDGNNSEFSNLNTTDIKLSEDINLSIYQNSNFVWISYNCPEGSYGTMDMTIESPNFTEPKNLHVSAQLGEWPSNKPELAPQNPESDLWWNFKGWTANPIWLKGLDTTAKTPQINFRKGNDREIQLSKKHFGKGTWKIKLEIRALKGPDGKFYSINFPETEASYSLEAN